MLSLDQIGVQSWCFRAFKSHAEVIEKVQEIGLRLVELSGAHLKPAEEEEDIDDVVAQYRAAGLKISAFGVYGFQGDVHKDRRVFELGKLAGFKTIDVDFGDEHIDLAEQLCTEFDMKVAIHNHGRHHARGSVAALEARFAKTTPRVGLCLDTAWMLDSGEDPVAVARRFAKRLYGLHVKDFVFDEDGKPTDVVVGTGKLDLDGLFQLLVEVDFDGFCSLEYEGDVDNPTPALKACIEKMRESLAKL